MCRNSEIGAELLQYQSLFSNRATFGQILLGKQKPNNVKCHAPLTYFSPLKSAFICSKDKYIVFKIVCLSVIHNHKAMDVFCNFQQQHRQVVVNRMNSF